MVEQVGVKFGADTSDLKAGSKEAQGEIRSFEQTVARLTRTVAALRQTVRTAFTSQKSTLAADANDMAAALAKVRSAATASAQALQRHARESQVAAGASRQATGAFNQNSQAAQNNASAINGARGAVLALVGAFGALGARAFVDDAKDAAFAAYGFETALRAVAGGARGAADSMAFVEEQAGRLGLIVRDSVSGFVSLAGATKGTRLEGQATQQIWLSLVEAGTALNRSNEQMKRGQEALTQIASKGVVSMEEIRQQLAEAIPGAVQISARALGISTAAFNDLVASGKLLSEDFLPKFAAQLRQEFAGELEASLNTPLGQARKSLAEFENSIFAFKQAMGTSFLTGLTEGVRGFAAELKSAEGLQTAADIGAAVAKALVAAGQAAVFLAQNIDTLTVAAQVFAGVALARFLAGIVREANLAALAYARQGLAARAAGAAQVAGNSAAAASSVGLQAALATQAAEELTLARAAVVAAAATEREAVAALAATRARISQTGATATLVGWEGRLAAATSAVSAAQTASVAASARAAGAQAALAASSTRLGAGVLALRGAFSGLLAMIGGPWGAAALLAVGTFFALQRAADAAAAELKGVEDRGLDAAAGLAETAIWATKAGGKLTALGDDAAGAITSIAQMTGEVDKLTDANYRLAASIKAKELAKIREAITTEEGIRGDAVKGRDKAMTRAQRRADTIVGYGVPGTDRVRDEIKTAMTTEAVAPFDVQIEKSDERRQELEKRYVTAASTPLKDERFMGPDRPAATGVPKPSGGGANKAKAEAEERLRNAVAALDAEKQAAEGNFQEQMRLQAEKLQRLKGFYGEDSSEYQSALREKTRMEQDHAQDVVRMERATLQARAEQRQAAADTDRELQMIALDERRSIIDAEFALGRISAAERAQQLRDVNEAARRLELDTVERVYQIQLQALRDELALQDLRPEARAQVLADIERLEADHANRLAVIRAGQQAERSGEKRAEGTDQFEQWSDNIQPFKEGMSAALQSIFTKAQSVRDILLNIGQGVLRTVADSFAQTASDMVARWLASHVQMSTISQAWAAFRTAMGWGQVAAQTAMQTAGVAAHAGAETAKTGATAAGVGVRTAINTGEAAAGIGLQAVSVGGHLTAEAAKTTATAVGVGARVGIETAGAATSIGLSAMTALADVANSAVRAAAGAYAAIAGIPVIGPFLAPAVAAGALAAVFALGSSIFSAAGGAESVGADGDIYELHKNEMVLPAKIATPLRSILKGMGPGSTGGALGIGAALGGAAGADSRARMDGLAEQIFQSQAAAAGGGGGRSFTINAVDSQSVRRMMEREGGVIADSLERKVRNLRRPKGYD